MSAYVEFAQQFGELIAKSNYAAAHSLLSEGAQAVTTAQDIREAVERMTDQTAQADDWGADGEDVQTPADQLLITPCPIEKVMVMQECILEEWPAKQEGDVAHVYVALTGDGFSEAVTVTIVQQGSDYRIRELVWGRP
jgi:hypothetical protein